MNIRFAAFAAGCTFLVFLVSLGNGFVALDDFAYIVNNRHIETLDTVSLHWILTAFHEGNWHPLAMLSLAVDRSIWGLNPFGYHLTSLLIHCSTVYCICFLFAGVLSAKGISASGLLAKSSLCCESGIMYAAVCGALLFGLHPLRVESVVWVSERKDVLCIFFLVVSLCYYLRYVKLSDENPNVPFFRLFPYWSSFCFAAMAMMSKPTAVSLPLILLIIDWYPLNRLSDSTKRMAVFIEKIPYILLAASGVVVTLAAQRVAMDSAPDITFGSRLLVACKALLFYLVKTVWPSNLSAFYLHPGNVAETRSGEYLLYVLIVVLICLLLVLSRRRQRFMSALGMYYLATITPMLGLIQVGGQWVADRYSYLPAMGLSLVWGAGVVWLVLRYRRAGNLPVMKCCIAIAVCQLCVYAVLTVRQIGVWKDTDTLSTRIIELAPEQAGAAYYARALYRSETGRYEQAHADITEALKIALRGQLKGTYAMLAMEQARILYRLGRYPEALAAADWAIETSATTLPIDFLILRRELVEILSQHIQNPASSAGSK